MIRVLITGACGVTSRSVVRSLKISKIFTDQIEFIGTDICNIFYAPYEGLYEKIYRVPQYNSPNYYEIMKNIIKENNIEYAFVIPELEALFWSKNDFNIRFMRIPPLFSDKVISKKILYDNLKNTGLVPLYQVVSKEEIKKCSSEVKLSFPLWVRDYSEGTTSGKGAYLAKDYNHLCSWLDINDNINTFMLSEYLPGRNLACFLSYNNGKLIQYGVAQRINYLMSKVAVSGITGNTSYGKLINDQNVVRKASSGVQNIINKTSETMNGLVVVDLKETEMGVPMITEINLRHVAFTSTFALAGLNFSEAQLLCMMGREREIPVRDTIRFSDDNAMLRDVDGLPIYVEHFYMPQVGQIFKA